MSSSAVSWSWDAEAAEVSDDATSFASPSIPVYKAQGFAPISVEALADEANITATVATLLAEDGTSLRPAALVTGSG